MRSSKAIHITRVILSHMIGSTGYLIVFTKLIWIDDPVLDRNIFITSCGPGFVPSQTVFVSFLCPSELYAKLPRQAVWL